MNKSVLPLLFYLLLSGFTSAQYRGQLLSDSLIVQMDYTAIKAVYATFGLQELWVPIEFQNIELYKLVYQTLDGHGDSLTLASGLLTIPVNHACNFPLMSFQHGALSYDDELSSFNAGQNQHYIGVPMAANGYVAAMPDYLGYGATPKDHPHPYIHAKSEATAVIDMLRAVREFCALKNIKLNNQVFLMGYSQGGHVTMAAHREIQEFYADEFSVTAAAPCSGPYDVSGIMRDSMLWTDKFSNPFFISFITLGYQYIYEDLYDDLNMVFQTPYVGWISRIYNREYPESGFIDSLPFPGTDMIQQEYLEEVIADSLHPFNVHLRQNDVYDWAPLAPVKMFYCTQDQEVPYQNALFTEAHMKALGALNVSSSNSGPYDHFGCTVFAVLGAKIWMDSYRQPCVIEVAGENREESWIHFTPNPFLDRIVVESIDNQPVSLSLFGVTGQQVWSAEVAGSREIRLPDVPPGSYFIHATGDGRQAYQKMVKQR
jgi:pimeloyl-ACP methyl ester carboxylesterase